MSLPEHSFPVPLLPFLFLFLFSSFSPSLQDPVSSLASLNLLPPLTSQPAWPRKPLRKVSTCCAIHHLSICGVLTTTMAPVTCLATCSMQLLLQETRSLLQTPFSKCFPSGGQANHEYIYVYRYIKKPEPKRGGLQ